MTGVISSKVITEERTTKMNTLNFYLVTDPHYYDNSFKRNGEAYEKQINYSCTISR